MRINLRNNSSGIPLCYPLPLRSPFIWLAVHDRSKDLDSVEIFKRRWPNRLVCAIG